MGAFDCAEGLSDQWPCATACSLDGSGGVVGKDRTMGDVVSALLSALFYVL